jgi:hypothetical protein
MIEIPDSTVQSIGESRMPLLKAALDALKNVSITNGLALITFWGNKGVGKTRLLSSIAEHLTTQQQVEIITNNEIGKSPVEELKLDLNEKIAEISRDKTVVILLDDLDELLRIDSQSFFDFERTFIQPLVEKGNVLILCTSQIELNQWHEDDVRIRQVNHRIQAMASKEVIAFLSGTGIPDKQAFKLTLGHPTVASWLREDPTLSERQLASRAWTYFLDDMPANALSLAEIVYQLPIFNMHILQKIYASLTGSELEYLTGLEWIKEYIRRGFMYWDVSIGSYRFTDSAVRRLLARHVVNSDPSMFDTVQNMASEYFQLEARSPGYLHMHFVSAIYHIAQAGRKLSQENTGQQCLDWLRSNKKLWASARWTEVLSAWQNGAGEPALCDEIRELIGKKQFDAITREIKTTRKSMEVKK